jgi:hypothetical protein
MSSPQISASQRASSPPAGARPEGASGGFLVLVGVTEDGRRLRLADPHDPSGPEFTVEIDARLRAALGVQPATRPEKPVPKVETQMDSMLRPRDIQARIRAGETPESVAAAAGTTVDKVMPYAAPVLAEREHVAERAQRSSIRRPAGEAAPSTGHGARTLGDAVTGHLHGRNVDPEVVAWDAWRREDGRWALTARFSVQGRDGLAELTYDQPGNFVVLDNGDARWLVGDVADVAEPAAPAAPADPEPGVRRLSAVPADDDQQLMLGDDVLGITDEPIEAFLDPQPAPDESELEDEVADAMALDDAPEPEPESPPARRPVKKTRGRASVPSWDEIMFGPGD